MHIITVGIIVILSICSFKMISHARNAEKETSSNNIIDQRYDYVKANMKEYAVWNNGTSMDKRSIFTLSKEELGL